MFPRGGTTKDIELNKEWLSTLPPELVSKMKEIVEILDDSYSADRNVLESLGGYCELVKQNCNTLVEIKINSWGVTPQPPMY